MKTGIVTSLIALCLPVPVFATNSRLSTDFYLRVIDGKKVAISLLLGSGACGIDTWPTLVLF
ncbi:hypothetical protein HmCmsJML022_02318 [Escherichia coli]|nr:hypothetical protein HmCmsJML022_02318 [Escherichia coli]